MVPMPFGATPASLATAVPRALGSLLAVLLAMLGLGCDHDVERPAVPAPRAVVTLPVPVSLPPLDPAAQSIRFAEVAAQRGLTHVWPEQPRPMRTLEAFGAGCAFFDADDDGWQDVLLVADPWPVLYRNDGTGRLIDVSPLCGFWDIEPGDWTGCAIGDYDGDGRLDVLLTGYHRLALMHNEGCFEFSECTTTVGLDPQNGKQWGASAGWMDLDGDRHLDLLILNYVVFGPDSQQYCEQSAGVRTGCPPKEYPPEYGEIWKNLRGEKLERVPPKNAIVHTNGVGLVVAFADLDNDNRIDCYLGNDAVASDLLHNLGSMQFENLGMIAGLAARDRGGPLAAMGADWGDFDRDGSFDLTVTDWEDKGFAVFHHFGPMIFQDHGGPLGVNAATRNRLGFGAKWIDMDNDGWLDLSYVNGHVYDAVHVRGSGATLRQRSNLLWSRAGKSFVDLVPYLAPEIGKPIVGRGSAVGDVDNDGRSDLLLVDYEGPPLLLHNQTENGAHWLTLDLRESPPNVLAYGARVIGKAEGQIWIGQVSPASSYLSSSDPRIHFGLGSASRLESLTIRWSSGREQVLENVSVDQVLRITESDPAAEVDPLLSCIE